MQKAYWAVIQVSTEIKVHFENNSRSSFSFESDYNSSAYVT